MTHFCATVSTDKSKNDKTACAHRSLTAHIRGWDIGARIELSIDPATGKDTVTVYRTGGSNGGSCGVQIAQFTKDDAS